MLPRVVNHVPEFLKEEVESVKSSENNMYSKPERVLLAWLNFHFKNQKEMLLRGTGNIGDNLINDVNSQRTIIVCSDKVTTLANLGQSIP